MTLKTVVDSMIGGSREKFYNKLRKPHEKFSLCFLEKRAVSMVSSVYK